MSDDIHLYKYLSMLFEKNAINMIKAEKNDLPDMAELCAETSLLILALSDHMKRIDEHITNALREQHESDFKTSKPTVN